MPFSALQSGLRNHATTLIALSLVLAMGASLAWQTADWLRLLRAPVASSEHNPSQAASASSPPQIGQLFGRSEAPGDGPAPETNLRLTLVGSFVNADPQRSTAIISSEGSPAQRYSIDSEVSSGVRLHAVTATSVELLRNGRRESLSFPLSQAYDSGNSYSRNQPPTEALEQLSDMEADNLAQLRERMDALREQMEVSGTLPTDSAPIDQPTEDN